MQIIRLPRGNMIIEVRKLSALKEPDQVRIDDLYDLAARRAKRSGQNK